MSRKEGLDYAPTGKAEPVCGPGDFPFAATGLDHGHVYGQCNGLIEAGGELRWVYDADPRKVEEFCGRYPQARPADRFERILEDSEIRMVTAAAVPCERGPLGIRVMEAGKDYFTDKTPFTTLDQLAEARETVKRTGRKYAVYYSERLHVECAVHAGNLVKDGVIGRVLQVLGVGPHRLSADKRPAWFFEREKYGGIIADLGSHQIEQFLYYSGSENAEILHAAVANYAHKMDYPELEDFGEVNLLGSSGAVNYFRVDWFTPDGLGAWGDGRTLILGTEGYIELRKYIDVGIGPEQDTLFLVTGDKEERMQLHGKVGFPFFGELILDCLQGTETAMTQKHTFRAAELCLLAQEQARRLE
ncbi:MAG TPA: Gfo/Idh/MocA family oxidoreductase [Verrucomicrobiales bacterium]|nr:Gfo/Idh/MocA family oxidoreductase [Verrucomicrobiales bacterium]